MPHTRRIQVMVMVYRPLAGAGVPASAPPVILLLISSSLACNYQDARR
jgi:hypothetical protein